jgi:hypothetical protein
MVGPMTGTRRMWTPGAARDNVTMRSWSSIVADQYARVTGVVTAYCSYTQYFREGNPTILTVNGEFLVSFTYEGKDSLASVPQRK